MTMTDLSTDKRREQLGAAASFASGGLLIASAFITALLCDTPAEQPSAD